MATFGLAKGFGFGKVAGFAAAGGAGGGFGKKVRKLIEIVDKT